MNRRGCIGSTGGLIHFQAVDEPVHVRKRARVVLDIALARRCECSAFGRARPHSTRPIAAEGGVEDLILVSVFKLMKKQPGGERKVSRAYNLLVLKVTINITASIELRNRSSPRGRVWNSIGDIGGCGASGEEPNVNHVARPFGRDHSSTDGIKASAIGSAILTLNVTAGICGLARGVDVAVAGSKGTSKCVAIHDSATV